MMESMNRENRQSELFGNPQPGLFDRVAAAPQLDEEKMRAIVRPKLAALLAEARRAERMPWDAKGADVNAIVFHQMANWLPVAERDALRLEFVGELERLRAAV
jgi:hypothetical protein